MPERVIEKTYNNVKSRRQPGNPVSSSKKPQSHERSNSTHPGGKPVYNRVIFFVKFDR